MKSALRMTQVSGILCTIQSELDAGFRGTIYTILYFLCPVHIANPFKQKHYKRIKL
jgi:hypothetical protein